MNNPKVYIFLFALVALIQLYVPGKMIWEREEVLEEGRLFKFETAPVDPSDPFRGKYITLNFANDSFMTGSEKEFSPGETVYVSLAENNEGYAIIHNLTKDEPADTPDYFKAKVDYTGDSLVYVNFPFDRFYMEERKAPEAERAFNNLRGQRDPGEAYAVVSIKNGIAVLQDVLIDGESVTVLAGRNE